MPTLPADAARRPVREPEEVDMGRSADGRARSFNPEEQRPFRFRPFGPSTRPPEPKAFGSAETGLSAGRPPAGLPEAARGEEREESLRNRRIGGVGGGNRRGGRPQHHRTTGAGQRAAGPDTAAAPLRRKELRGRSPEGEGAVPLAGFGGRRCESAAEPRGAGPEPQSRGHAGRARVEAQPDRQQQPRGCKPSSGKKKYAC